MGARLTMTLPLLKATSFPLRAEGQGLPFGRQLAEGSDNAVGPDRAVGQAGAGTVEPDSAKSQPLGAGHVEFEVVADHRGPARRDPQPIERVTVDRLVRFAG